MIIRNMPVFQNQAYNVIHFHHICNVITTFSDLKRKCYYPRAEFYKSYYYIDNINHAAELNRNLYRSTNAVVIIILY